VEPADALDQLLRDDRDRITRSPRTEQQRDQLRVAQHLLAVQLQAFARSKAYGVQVGCVHVRSRAMGLAASTPPASVKRHARFARPRQRKQHEPSAAAS
jgi:hypothetical protein